MHFQNIRKNIYIPTRTPTQPKTRHKQEAPLPPPPPHHIHIHTHTHTHTYTRAHAHPATQPPLPPPPPHTHTHSHTYRFRTRAYSSGKTGFEAKRISLLFSFSLLLLSYSDYAGAKSKLAPRLRKGKSTQERQPLVVCIPPQAYVNTCSDVFAGDSRRSKQ